MSDSFCPLPWIQVSVKPSGMMTTCCVMRPVVKSPSKSQIRRQEIQQQMTEGDVPFSRLWWENSDNIYVCGKDSMFDVMNGPMLNEVRLSMLKGEKHKACGTCWSRERYSNGKISVRVRIRRQWDNRFGIDEAKKITNPDGSLTDIDIKNIELRFGNLCNLKCVMCHPGHSSLWYDDWKKLSEMKTFWTDDGSDIDSFMFGGVRYSMSDDSPFNWYKTEKFKEDFRQIYEGLNEIYWAGGEPLLCEEHFQIVDALIHSGESRHIRMRYDSNATHIPTSLIDKWKHFKWIGVQASVDDVGVRNNYIRYPSKWRRIAENLKLLDNEGVGHSGTTISCYNVLTFLEFAKWARRFMSRNFWETMHFKHVIAPFHLSPEALPKHVKERAIDRIDEYLKSDESPHPRTMHHIKVDMFKNYLIEVLDTFDDRFYQGFLQHTRNLDTIRPLKFKDCFPELYGMIQEDYDGVC